MEGDDWSKESFDVLKRYFAENREAFITSAKEASQWRSLIQTVFIILASVSVLVLWFKLNHVA